LTETCRDIINTTLLYFTLHCIVRETCQWLYGSETWTNKPSDARGITAAEMKYMRRTAEYILTDYKTNAQIAKKLKKKHQFWTNYWNTREAGYNM